MLIEGRDPHYDEGDPATILSTFEAESWEEAMKEYHRIMGWAPYEPYEVARPVAPKAR